MRERLLRFCGCFWNPSDWTNIGQEDCSILRTLLSQGHKQGRLNRTFLSLVFQLYIQIFEFGKKVDINLRLYKFLDKYIFVFPEFFRIYFLIMYGYFYHFNFSRGCNNIRGNTQPSVQYIKFSLEIVFFFISTDFHRISSIFLCIYSVN